MDFWGVFHKNLRSAGHTFKTLLSRNTGLVSQHQGGADRLSANPSCVSLSEWYRRQSSHSSTDATDVRPARLKCNGAEPGAAMLWKSELTEPGQWHEKVLGWKIQFPCLLPAPPKMYKQSWWISMLIDTIACFSTVYLTVCGSMECIHVKVSYYGLGYIAVCRVCSWMPAFLELLFIHELFRTKAPIFYSHG